ncbi:hypothetical protein V8E36_009538 [Tilletia maclaganii]
MVPIAMGWPVRYGETRAVTIGRLDTDGRRRLILSCLGARNAVRDKTQYSTDITIGALFARAAFGRDPRGARARESKGQEATNVSSDSGDMQSGQRPPHTLITPVDRRERPRKKKTLRNTSKLGGALDELFQQIDSTDETTLAYSSEEAVALGRTFEVLAGTGLPCSPRPKILDAKPSPSTQPARVHGSASTSSARNAGKRQAEDPSPTGSASGYGSGAASTSGAAAAAPSTPAASGAPSSAPAPAGMKLIADTTATAASATATDDTSAPVGQQPAAVDDSAVSGVVDDGSAYTASSSTITAAPSPAATSATSTAAASRLDADKKRQEAFPTPRPPPPCSHHTARPSVALNRPAPAQPVDDSPPPLDLAPISAISVASASVSADLAPSDADSSARRTRTSSFSCARN